MTTIIGLSSHSYELPPTRPPVVQLQAPSVKGFDFAKLHLGQQSKDDVIVIQEPGAPGPGPGALPVSIKDVLGPSENGDIPSPASKNSAFSTKASRSGRRRERSVHLHLHSFYLEH